MTIRYKCEECDSVLKIRDELAGTDGKCPKCKTAFTVPAAAKKAVTAGGPPEEADEFADLDEDPIDMPQEITPKPDFSKIPDSLPEMPAVGGIGATSDPEAPAVPRPSVAELMREHEETKKKKKKQTEKKKRGGLAEAAAAAEVMTSGTASDALTRAYDQKRGKAGEPPPMTREERREAEQKEAMLDFAKKAGAGLGVLAIFLYFFISWLFGEKLPPLQYVSGVVTLNGAPLTDVEVQFAPVSPPGQPPPENARPSSGYTNSSGEYILMYDVDVEGAIPGRGLPGWTWGP